MKKLILISLLFVPLIAGASFDKNLYYGLQSDPQVKELQEFLTDQGVYYGPITGNFYSLTLAGVKAFQQREGISPVAGYFGQLTRTKTNEILSASVEASNQQAVQETGSTPPPAEPAKTTNDVVSSLQSQIALLVQQLALLQSQVGIQQQQTQIIQQQQQTIQQIQQNTQQIAQNTAPTITPVPTPTPELPTFEFNPIIKVGGTNPNGTHWYPQLINTDSGGYIVTDIGHVYFSINESFDSGIWSIKDLATGEYYIVPRGFTIGGKAIKPGEVVDLTGFISEKTYEYKFTMEKAGYRSNTKTGTFAMPSAQIYTEKRIKPWPNHPELPGEFIFYHWGGGIEGSILNLKIKVFLRNQVLPNELDFNKNQNSPQTFTNISDGQILEINSFPSNYQLGWSYSGNPDDLSLDIIEGSATKNGQNVDFKF